MSAWANNFLFESPNCWGLLFLRLLLCMHYIHMYVHIYIIYMLAYIYIFTCIWIRLCVYVCTLYIVQCTCMWMSVCVYMSDGHSPCIREIVYIHRYWKIYPFQYLWYAYEIDTLIFYWNCHRSMSLQVLVVIYVVLVEWLM